MSQKIDVSGQVYGLLTVLRDANPFITKYGQPRRMVLCLCECGGQKTILLTSVKNGNTRSCGCLLKKNGRPKSPIEKRIDGKRTKEYQTWISLRQRCLNPKNKNYYAYGARGISVCTQWSDFRCFLADMGKAPSFAHSIDRINNKEGYSPKNCRWATNIEQSNNRRSNKVFCMNGESKTMKQWCQYFGFHTETFRARLNKGQEFSQIYDEFMQRKIKRHPHPDRLP